MSEGVINQLEWSKSELLATEAEPELVNYRAVFQALKLQQESRIFQIFNGQSVATVGQAEGS